MKTRKLPWTLWTVILSWGILAPMVQAEIPYTDTFFQEGCHWAFRGANDYFIPLKPGCFLVLRGNEENDEGETEEVVVYIRVMPQTKIVAGVRCAVIREMEWVDGELVEISYNYFALCIETKAIFYFGEDVDIYENGVVVNHEGAWRAGKNGARAGLIMPGQGLIGSRYYQELAAPVALDRAEHLDNKTTIVTPAGTFPNCLFVAETTPLEPDALGFKAYARGIGLILDGTLRLINFGCED